MRNGHKAQKTGIQAWSSERILDAHKYNITVLTRPQASCGIDGETRTAPSSTHEAGREVVRAKGINADRRRCISRVAALELFHK